MGIWRDNYEEVDDSDRLKKGYFNELISKVVPVGSIVAWTKSLSGVPQTIPDGWNECDGTVISDSDSPINGKTIPDLNGGNRFLRGNSTSGATGGSETADFSHGHDYTLSQNWDSDNDGAINNIDPNNTLDGKENRPPFYDVVWIMRYK